MGSGASAAIYTSNLKGKYVVGNPVHRHSRIKGDPMGSCASATRYNSKSLGASTLSGILCVGILE